jgi:hypothetical protein
MLRDNIAQQNDVNGCGETFVPSKTFYSSFPPRRNDTVSRNGLKSKVSAFLVCIAFARWAWRSDLARNWACEMLHMIARALPGQRALVAFTFEQR